MQIWKIFSMKIERKTKKILVLILILLPILMN